MKPASPLLLVALTLSMMIIATFGEFAPGQLGHAFTTELDVPTSMFGVFVSIIFATGGVFSIPAGWIVDRFSPRILSPIQIVISGVAFSLFAFSESVVGLLVTSFAIGLTMCMANPLSNRIITLYAPRSAFARIMGWKSVGPQAGGVLAGVTLGGFAGVIPWRILIIVIAVAMVLSAVWFWWMLNHRAQYVAPGTDEAANAPGDDDVAPTRTRPIVWWLLPFLFFSGGVVGSVAAYLPLYATDEIGLSVAAGGAAVSVIAAVSVVMRFVWIRFLNARNAVFMLLLAGLLTVVTSLLLVMSPGFPPWVFWVAVVLVGSTALGSTPIPQIVLLQNANPAKIGIISGWSSVALLGGFTAQPWAISVFMTVADFQTAWLTLTFCGFAAAATIFIYALVHGWRRRPQRDLARGPEK